MEILGKEKRTGGREEVPYRDTLRLVVPARQAGVNEGGGGRTWKNERASLVTAFNTPLRQKRNTSGGVCRWRGNSLG